MKRQEGGKVERKGLSVDLFLLLVPSLRSWPAAASAAFIAQVRENRAVCRWSQGAGRLLAAAIYCRSKASLSCMSQKPLKSHDEL